MSALNEYCLLLARDSERIGEVRQSVSAALGDEGRVLAALLPNLAEILPPEQRLAASSNPDPVWVPEAQQRLAYLSRMLLRSTCRRERPLVLFLDDLQWADVSSLELMRALVTDAPLDALLVIGSYRDNEVGPGHILQECFDAIERIGRTAVSRVDVRNLDIESVHALVTDALHMIPRTTRSLAEVVLQKTGGNALFMEQFLTSLHDEGLLRYSLLTRRWEWDIDVLQARNIANNVVELMRAKLLRLAPAVLEAIRIAASFGLQCHEDVLRALDLDACRVGRALEALDVAVSEGLMAKVEGPAFRFSHDQIQSAAYMLIPETEREHFHLEIGRSLWRHSSVKERDANLFIVVDQMHRGSRCISNHDENVNLAQLSLMAAQKAATMSAFLPSSVYLASGIGLLREEDWIANRDLCLDLFNLSAEMEFVLGKFSKVKALSEEVIARGTSLSEKLRAYYTLVRSSIARSGGNSMDPFVTAFTVLRHLGECLPSSVSLPDIQQEIMKTQAILRTQRFELLELKEMTDVDKRQAMKFLYLVSCYSVWKRQEYFPYLACRMVQISISYGVCKESVVAFTFYGMVICGFAGDTDGGYQLGKAALNLMERFHGKEYSAIVSWGVYGYINNWIQPIQSSISPLKEAIDVGLSTGDPVCAMTIANFYHGSCLASGKALGPLMQEMNEYAKQMLELNQNVVYTLNRPLRQFTLNLLGKSADPVKLIGEVMNEDALLPEEGDTSVLRSLVLFYRMWLEYLFGEYELAAETAARNKHADKHNSGRFVIVCNKFFYHGLAALALARKQGHSKWADTINSTMAQMRKWTVSTPWNCMHKLELLNAEYAYLEGDLAEAAKKYDRAASVAAEHHFVHEEALALERAGIFYLETGDHTKASTLFGRAHDCYARWEAHSKVAHVQRYL
uniref:Orc1-like AAA ATPase domain-containing protein n=1 Tax=Pseudictyota dubia TaxID=2749911 RepID=A0A7R9WCS1_9STRA